MKSLLSGTRIRVQNGGSAFQLDAAGNRSTISPFVTVRGGCQPGPNLTPPASPAPLPEPAAGPAAAPHRPAADHRPASGAMVNGIAMVTVTADGITGIRRVDLYVDGVREQADDRGPFLFTWPAFTLPREPTPCGRS